MAGLEALEAALDAERAAAAPCAPPSEMAGGASSVATPDLPAADMPQTVTVLRGKRSRRTPLAAFHGLLQAVASSRGDVESGDEEAEEAEAEPEAADSDSDAPRAKRRAARCNVQAWGEAEDAQLAALLQQWLDKQPPGSLAPPPWADLAGRLATRRTGKQCRDRYVNHLAPDISRAEWTDTEERVLAGAYTRLGAKWAALARELPGRTENAVKNHWHATLRCKSATRGAALRFLKAFQLSLGLGVAVAGAAATAALADLADAGESAGTAPGAVAAAATAAGAPAMPPPARATVLAKLSQPAVATLSTADALVSLALASSGARGSRTGSALFAAAASMASADAEAGGGASQAPPPPPRVTSARSARGALHAAAARDSAATADAVLSPARDAAAGAAADGDAAADDDDDGSGDPRDFFVISDAPLTPLALAGALRRCQGLQLQHFAFTASEAQRLTFARAEGRAQLAELAAKLRRRCPAVRAVALAMRAGAVAAGERVYAGAVAAPHGEAGDAAVFAAERMDLMAKLMREPAD